jgi:N-acetylglucosaminyldiphosphoundecaprenol N-acetyl-beta-D-mannosaminyltransferase
LKTKGDSEFKKLLQKADYLTPDGIGLYIAFQMLSTRSFFLRILLLPYYLFNLFFRKKYLYKKY